MPPALASAATEHLHHYSLASHEHQPTASPYLGRRALLLSQCFSFPLPTHPLPPPVADSTLEEIQDGGESNPSFAHVPAQRPAPPCHVARHSRHLDNLRRWWLKRCAVSHHLVPRLADTGVVVEARPTCPLRGRLGPGCVFLLCHIPTAVQPRFIPAKDLTSPLTGHSLDHPRWHAPLDRLDVSAALPQPPTSPFPTRQGGSPRELTTAPCWGSSRPSVKQEKIGGDNTEVNKWVGRYLGLGESVLDLAITTAGQSGWFERTR